MSDTSPTFSQPALQLAIQPQPSPHSIPIDLPPHEKTCSECKMRYPHDENYFPKKGRYLSIACHECVYKQKVAEGTTPRFPAKNGVNQKVYHAELKKRDKTMAASSAPPPNMQDSVDPWMKHTSSKQADEPQYFAQQESAPTQPSENPKHFDTRVSLEKQGDVNILHMNDYFLDSTHQLSQEAEGEGEEYGEEMQKYINPRSELYKEVAIHPAITANLNIDNESIHQMDEEEAAHAYDMVSSVIGIHRNGGFVQKGISKVCDGIGYALTGVDCGEGYHLDLRGYGDAVEKDEQIGDLCRELSYEWEDELTAALRPEYLLLFRLLSLGQEVNEYNHHH